MATAGGGLQGLSARGLVSLERAEDILQRVIDQVNLQAMQMASMMAVMETLVDHDTMARALARVEGSVSRLSEHVAAVDDAMHVPGSNDPRVTIGQLVGSHGQTLSSVCEALAGKAEERDVTRRMQEMKRTTEAQMNEMYDWAAPRDVMERLQEASRASHQQVQALEQNMACKVDKADMSYMDSVVSKLKSFNSFVDDTNHRITVLENDVSGLSSEMKTEVMAAQALTQRVDRAEQELADRDEMRSLLSGVRDLDARLKCKADMATVTEAVQRQEGMERELRHLQEEYSEWKAENLGILSEINKELEHTAPLEEVDHKLDSRVFDKKWRVAVERLEGKAESSRVEVLAHRVDRAEQVLHQLERKSELALRFVNWFSERGQAYEHNLQTLDRTIGRLAQTSLPARRMPHDGRVRFTTEGGGGGGGGGPSSPPPPPSFSASSSPPQPPPPHPTTVMPPPPPRSEA